LCTWKPGQIYRHGTMVRRLRRTEHFAQGETRDLVAAVRSVSLPIGSPVDLGALIERVGDARFVLLGEASHGTHEYYAWRAEITRRLVEEKQFSFIAVEGDWPDCYRVNRFVKGYDDAGETGREVLHTFERWPTWMWANEEVADLIEWLREHNARQPDERKVGFYGLDVYSLWDSLYQVLGYLGKHLPSALPAARRAFQCFEPYGEDVEDYARATRWVDASCEREVISLLGEIRRSARKFPHDGQDGHFNAEQNALIVKNAEHYYRTMIGGGPESWNIRDRHMAQTLERLVRQHGPNAKAIVWEHNTHIGDARFTDMAEDGMVNVGQLVREAHRDETFLVGFGSHHGTVIAGAEWGAPMERMTVPAAQAGSWEDVLHQAGLADQLLLMDAVRADEQFLARRGQRAIGVVYHPDYEQYGNYVPTVLPQRYDAFIFLDETAALRPLGDVQPQDDGEVPETYPSGV
jgi:erythromycin esterase